MSSFRNILAIMACLLFAVGPVHAQTTTELAPALQGMDVVSYFKDGGPKAGHLAYRHDFDGARYVFANEQNKAAFIADPDRYLPQFSGLCTTGISLGKELKGDPNTWKIVDGKLYLYYSGPVRAKGDADPTTIAKAHQNWVARK